MPNSPKSERQAPGIGEALRAAGRQLADSSPSARLDAEVLLANVMARSRTFLRTWPETQLTEAQWCAFEGVIAQRVAGLPVAYLTGTREFWSREFIVSPEVLIPRPETELLVEIALAAIQRNPAATVLDLATGSGAIAVTLAAECTAVRVYASDISETALDIARRNAERHAANRIHWLQSDWFTRFPADLLFDVIVSNPPYIRDADPHLREGDVRFEPRLALQAGPDGLDAYRIIAEQARTRLRSGGTLLLEHGYEQAEAVKSLLERYGYRAITPRADLQGHLRVTLAATPDILGFNTSPTAGPSLE